MSFYRILDLSFAIYFLKFRMTFIAISLLVGKHSHGKKVITSSVTRPTSKLERNKKHNIMLPYIKENPRHEHFSLELAIIRNNNLAAGILLCIVKHVQANQHAFRKKSHLTTNSNSTAK